MSDRAILRSYATMQGFGVQRFRLTPPRIGVLQISLEPEGGTHSLVWMP
jgi:catalase